VHWCTTIDCAAAHPRLLPASSFCHIFLEYTHKHTPPRRRLSTQHSSLPPFHRKRWRHGLLQRSIPNYLSCFLILTRFDSCCLRAYEHSGQSILCFVRLSCFPVTHLCCCGSGGVLRQTKTTLRTATKQGLSRCSVLHCSTVALMVSHNKCDEQLART
jgi:hypothetical protein